MVASKYIRKRQFASTTKLRSRAHKVMLKEIIPRVNEAAEMVALELSLWLEPPLLDGCVHPQPFIVNFDQR